ncbi:hypothetical protein [Sinorhizobium arboris]
MKRRGASTTFLLEGFRFGLLEGDATMAEASMTISWDPVLVILQDLICRAVVQHRQLRPSSTTGSKFFEKKRNTLPLGDAAAARPARAEWPS